MAAVVLCPKVVRTYLINFAKSFRYTTALPASTLQAISHTYDFLKSSERADRAVRVLDMAQYLRQALESIGFHLVIEKVPLSPIVCIHMSNPRELCAWLEKKGFSVTPVTFPLVQRNAERIRICLHSNNTREQIDRLMGMLTSWSLRVHL
jgi:8-amino-7-oxononanoate synthase